MSLQSSYWAGFIAADGCIRSKPYYSLEICISSKDLDILERFKADIEWDGPINNITRTTGNISSIAVCQSKRWIGDLEEIYNITTRKTFTLKPPIITGLNKLAYIVGLIDGDGCIGLYGNNKNRHTLQVVTASTDMAHWLSVELGDLSNRSKDASIYQHINTYTIVLSCRYARTTLLRLKSIDVRKLDRKWNQDLSISQQDNRLNGSSISIALAKEIKSSYTGERGDAPRLAKEYGVSRKLVYDLVAGRTWKILNEIDREDT